MPPPDRAGGVREADRTTRQRIADAIHEDPHTPSKLADTLAVPRSVVLTHLEHIARSFADASEQLLVSPPACRDCGFDGFDDLVNVPSRCPDCRSESIADPVFVIE